MDESKNRKKIIEKEMWTDKIEGKPLINVTAIYGGAGYLLFNDLRFTILRSAIYYLVICDLLFPEPWNESQPAS